ncbi:MAG: AMP-binding protein [Arhodomonas sp.]|nr:AMP-binding protein [Arhodomonas sp.]
MIPESGGFDADEVCDLLTAHQRVSFFAAPTMVKRLGQRVRERDADVSAVRTIIYGGGPMYLADLREATAIFGHRLAEIYGQGESPMTITAKSRSLHAHCDRAEREYRLASVGMPQAVVEVRIVDEQGRRLPTGEVGEIIVRGDPVMLGYWNNPDATHKTVVDGWLYTGDRGCLDERGLLYLKDRSKDVIISGGTNIYTREVEDALLTHPASRGIGDRPSGSGVGGDGGRLRRGGQRRRGGREDLRPSLRRAHRPLQATQGISLRRRTAQERLREDRQKHPARMAAPETARQHREVGMEHYMIGWGHTPFGKLAGRDIESLIVDAAGEALADAGTAAEEIDAIFLGHFNSGMSPQDFCAPLVLQLDERLRFKPATRVENACASGSAALHQGLNYLASGAGHRVLVVGVEKMTDAGAAQVADSLLGASYRKSDLADTELGFAGVFARIAQAYFAAYGEQSDVLARIAAKNHRNGTRNPHARLQKDVGFDLQSTSETRWSPHHCGAPTALRSPTVPPP